MMYANNSIDAMKYLRDKKIFLFGAGKLGTRLMRKFKERGYDVVGFIDNDISKKGKMIGGGKILGSLRDVEEIIDDEAVIVLGAYEIAEMQQEVLDMRLPYIVGKEIDFNDTNESYYGQEYLEWQINISKFNAKYDIEQFTPYIKETDSVLEFGCAEGFLLKRVNAKEKIGVEINDFAREYAEKEGIQCVKYIDQIADESIDIVISTHVLEHVDNPLETIKKLKEKLREGGKAVFIVPYERKQMDYRIEDMDQHLYTWNCLHIGNLFKRAGYFVKEVRNYKLQWPAGYEKMEQSVGRDAFLQLSKCEAETKEKENVLIVAIK